jgi:signal transduction histidine kinase
MIWQPEQVDLWDLVNEVVNLLRGSAENKQIHLEAIVDEDLSAFVDPNMINTVVRNLVSNAIKFTPCGGEVVVESRQTKDFVEITVRDSGVGIKPEDIEKLFRIDEHVIQNGTENETGTGLGLILCKEFIDKHNGQLFVKSEANKGSSFIFTLPIV